MQVFNVDSPEVFIDKHTLGLFLFLLAIFLKIHKTQFFVNFCPKKIQ